jgi:hypothetical protein
MWSKLGRGWIFTTFRLPRLDKDWQEGEIVQVVLHHRSKDEREVLGLAKIISVEPRQFDESLCGYETVPFITENEAINDGFESRTEMFLWMKKAHRADDRFWFLPLNKLTLEWVRIHNAIDWTKTPINKMSAGF